MKNKGFIEGFFNSCELYQVLIENAPEAIIFTIDSVVVDCNLAATRLLGFGDNDQIIGKNFNELSADFQKDNILLKNKLLSEDSINKQPKKFDLRFLKQDGTILETEVTINSFQHDHKTIQQYKIQDVTSIRSKEFTLSQTELKYKKIFENVQDVFYRTDMNGILTEISPSIKKYSKYVHSDIIGQPIENFYVDPSSRQKLLNEILERGEALDVEILLKGKENLQVWASVNAHFTYDEFDKISGVEGTIRDLTERKQAEEELKQSLSLLKATLDSTINGILVVDLNGKITSFNRRFKEIFNHLDEILDSKRDDYAINAVLNQLKDPDQFISKIKYLYDNPEIESNDRIELIDGKILERYSGPQLLDGKPIGRIWSFNDITERVKAEQQLLLMAQTVKCVNESISITDTKNQILFVNEAFLKTYGYTDTTELIGKNISIVRSKHDHSTEISEILKATEKTGWRGEVMNKRKDDSEFPISLSTSIIQNENGEIQGMVGVATDITKQKNIEIELRESEERYRTFFDGSPDAIILADTETGIIINVNNAACKLLKKPINEIVGLHHTMIHPTENNDFTKEVFTSKSTLKKGQQNVTENSVISSDGKIIPVEISANRIQIKGRSVLQGMFRDITDRKIVEKKLQENEAFLSTLIRTIPDLIWVKDIDGKYLTCNKMFENFFGFPTPEIIGKTDYDFVNKDLADFFRKNDSIAIKAGKPTSNEEWVTFASDGHTALLETIKTPMIDSSGTIFGVLGIGRDITARHRAEEMLRESEVKYRNLIETMPDGYYRSTPEGKFVEVNEAMVNMLGYSTREELLAIDIKTQLYFKPEDRESHILDSNPDILDIYPLKRKDGSAVWIEDHGWYVKDVDGNIIFHEGVTRDITDRRNSEIQLQKYSEELKELNTTKDKYFSIIAHDLKSPFNSIIGLSEIIKNDAYELEVSSISQYAGIINSTSKNTYQLLENLLDWARIQQSKMPFQPVLLVLKTIVNDIIDLLIEKANSKMIAIINYIPENIIVAADKNMFETILRNLISNALKFTNNKGRIDLRAKDNDTEILISVSDTGTGIKPEDISKIFNPGANYTKKGTQNEKGTGLGLLLCKEFVEKHNGKIWVESQVNVGSTFYFTISKKLVLS